jgi:glutamine synthetase type III
LWSQTAIVSAVDIYGDLLRMSISCPGNDFRLGAMEAPPAVVSTYLGKQMSDYLTRFSEGTVGSSLMIPQHCLHRISALFARLHHSCTTSLFAPQFVCITTAP